MCADRNLRASLVYGCPRHPPSHTALVQLMKQRTGCASGTAGEASWTSKTSGGFAPWTSSDTRRRGDPSHGAL
ncbi:MAG: hypothetical protein ABGY24_10520 [bacterium]